MSDHAFERLEQTFRESGPEAVFDLLVREAREEKNYRVLFGARMMQIRHRLGLPLIETEPVTQLAGEQLAAYETALKEAARETGALFLSDGDIVSAWPYFKAIGDSAPVNAAIENVNGGDNTQGDKLEQVIAIAFQEGVNPRKGFELILQHRGICSAITWFGSIQNYDSRQACLRLLVRSLYSELANALKETIAANEGAVPATGSVAELMAGRPWLFEGPSYYVDSTHLTSVLRFAPELEDADTLRMALEMAEYGRCLDPMFHFRGDPPFEETYADHAVYLRALLGQDVDAAILHFRNKAAGPDSAPGDTTPAEVLIDLLVRLGRYAEAIQASLEFLPDSTGAPRSCPTVLQLCQMAGAFDKLRRLAAEREDRLGFAAGVIQG